MSLFSIVTDNVVERNRQHVAGRDTTLPRRPTPNKIAIKFINGFQYETVQDSKFRAFKRLKSIKFLNWRKAYGSAI